MKGRKPVGGVKAGCVLWIEGANTKECTGCVCGGGGEEGGFACHQECVREIFETRTFEYLKRERYFVSASHSGLSSSPLS